MEDLTTHFTPILLVENKSSTNVLNHCDVEAIKYLRGHGEVFFTNFSDYLERSVENKTESTSTTTLRLLRLYEKS